MEDLIFELRRKIFHILSAIYIFIYYFAQKFFSRETALLILILFLIILSFVEFLKIRYNAKIPFFYALYRENEKKVLSGSIYLLIGTIIALAVFDFNIAVTAILMMIFGDSASALFGRIGNHKIKWLNISYEGIIAELLIDFAVGFIFLSNIFIIIAMAITATLVEIFLKSIDDNLAVPIAAGFAGQSLTIIFRILNI